VQVNVKDVLPCRCAVREKQIDPLHRRPECRNAAAASWATRNICAPSTGSRSAKEGP
jgi:hypothetical protein